MLDQSDALVRAALHPKRKDVVLVASENVAANSVLFTEEALVDSLGELELQSVLPDKMPYDFEVMAFKHLRHVADRDSSVAAKLYLRRFNLLSTNAVTSPMAKSFDESRGSDYLDAARELAKAWLQAVPFAKEDLGLLEQAVSRLYSVLDTNCHSKPKGDSSGANLSNSAPINDESALFFLGSLMEHSCTPNCRVSLDFTNGPAKISVISTSEIVSGDLVTISYLPQELLSFFERTLMLKSKGFACACKLCTLEARQVCGYMTLAACTACGLPIKHTGHCSEGHKGSLCEARLREVERLLVTTLSCDDLPLEEQEALFDSLDRCIDQFMDFVRGLDWSSFSVELSKSTAQSFAIALERFLMKLHTSSAYKTSLLAPVHILSAVSLQFLRLIQCHLPDKQKLVASLLLVFGDLYLMQENKLRFTNELEADFRVFQCLQDGCIGASDLDSVLKLARELVERVTLVECPHSSAKQLD